MTAVSPLQEVTPTRFAAAASALLAAGYAFLLALRKIENYDIWWHMKVGEQTVQTGRVLLEETLSHTFAGTKWIPHEWLSEVFFYLVHRTGGVEGLGLFSAAIVALAALVAWLRGRGLGAQPWTLVFFLAWMLLAARFRFMVRPHIFFFLLAGGLLFLLERHDATGNKRYLYGTLPVMLLWVNLHGSFPLGYLFFGAWTLSRFLSREFLLPTGIFITAILLAVFNPGGIDNVLSIRDLFVVTTASKTVVNEEFMPPGFGGYRFFWSWLAFSAIVLLATFRKRRLTLLEAAVLLLPLVLSLKGARYIADFVFVATPYMAGRLSLMAGPSEMVAGFRQIVMALFVLLFMVWGFAVVYAPGKSYKWGLGVNETFYPVGAVKFLKSTELKDIRLYNSKHFGGYLTWHLYPRFRVAIDGRDEVFAPLQARLNIHSFTKYRNLMKEYGFQFALIAYDRKNEFEAYLVSDPVWRLIYWDDEALIYARQNLIPESFIAPLEYKYIFPLSVDYGYLAGPVKEGKGAAVIAELERAAAFSPESFKPYVYLGFVRELMGETARAIEAYDKALNANAKLALLHYDLGAKLGSLYLKANRPEKAVEIFKRHFELNPKKGESLYRYALSLYQAKNFKLAEEEFKRYLAGRSDDRRALTDLAFLLLDTGRIEQAQKAFSKAWEDGFYPPALFGLALSYQKQGDCARAIPLWQTFIKADGTAEDWKARAAAHLEGCKDKAKAGGAQ